MIEEMTGVIMTGGIGEMIEEVVAVEVEIEAVEEETEVEEEEDNKIVKRAIGKFWDCNFKISNFQNSKM